MLKPKYTRGFYGDNSIYRTCFIVRIWNRGKAVKKDDFGNRMNPEN